MTLVSQLTRSTSGCVTCLDTQPELIPGLLQRRSILD